VNLKSAHCVILFYKSRLSVVLVVQLTSVTTATPTRNSTVNVIISYYQLPLHSPVYPFSPTWYRIMILGPRLTRSTTNNVHK
jgi:hypothetical protein